MLSLPFRHPASRNRVGTEFTGFCKYLWGCLFTENEVAIYAGVCIEEQEKKEWEQRINIMFKSRSRKNAEL